LYNLGLTIDIESELKNIKNMSKEAIEAYYENTWIIEVLYIKSL